MGESEPFFYYDHSQHFTYRKIFTFPMTRHSYVNVRNRHSKGFSRNYSSMIELFIKRYEIFLHVLRRIDILFLCIYHPHDVTKS